MPFYDFRCNAGHVHEELMKWEDLPNGSVCPECGTHAKQVILTTPKLNYLAMGAQENVSPEFQKKWDKMHTDQKAKEEKSLEAHGDYGASHGYAKPVN
jgi:putative FmdB family regulatory protein